MANCDRAHNDGRIALEIFQCQVTQLGRVLGADARQVVAGNRVEQFDEDVVASGRVPRLQFSHDNVFVIATRSVDPEIGGHRVLVPGPALETQVQDSIDIGRRPDRIGVEQQVDAVEVSVPIVIAKKHQVD
jgi:hypothetical protein